jgi:hypothetical protein
VAIGDEWDIQSPVIAYPYAPCFDLTEPGSKGCAGLLIARLGNLLFKPATALLALMNRKLSKTFTRDPTKNLFESKSRLIRSTKTVVSQRFSKVP